MRLEDSRDLNGILPSQWIRRAIEEGVITSAREVWSEQIQPNSMDLRLGDKGYRVRCSFLPGKEGMGRKLKRLASYTIPLDDEGFVLETNLVYLFELCEGLNLPKGITARTNPKSTTGRLDVFVRVITEQGTVYDEAPRNYTGPLYLEVVPRSFAIRVRPGDTLAQIRFQVGQPVLTDVETRELLDSDHIIIGPDGRTQRSKDMRIQQGAFLSVSLGPADKTIGFRAKRNSRPIDLREIGGSAIKPYWERMYHPNEMILEPDEFYIFASRELVRLPPNYCAEMVPFDASSGELRTHYAGFFDSGFGYSGGRNAYETAASVVLEVRNRDVPYLIEDGRPLFRLLFLKNAEPPDMLYGQGIGSNYQSQRLKLSKHFSVYRDTEEEYVAPASQPALDFRTPV